MDYSNMQLDKLKEEARKRGIKGVSTLKKSDLIGRLEQYDKENAPREESVVSANEERKQEKFQDRRVMRQQPERAQNERQQYERQQPERAQNERQQYERQQPERVQNERVQYERQQPERTQYDRQQNEVRPEEQSERHMEPEMYDTKEGIFEMGEGSFGFIRCDNFLPGDKDVYVSADKIRYYGLKTGDYLKGTIKVGGADTKFAPLYELQMVNGGRPKLAKERRKFENLTPIYPEERIKLASPGAPTAMRMVDLFSPIGKGQRGMIVSPPKAGKTTLLKNIAQAVTVNHPEMHLIILLIDERPEEVTDMKDSIHGENVEIIYSTFDEQPSRHMRVSEMVIERAKRLVEDGRDVIILLDSITRLARAYNLTVAASGRTLSGGLDPAALYMPKKFFGAARNIRKDSRGMGGSLTILATALIDTGSRMDDVVFEEFKGTGNMELVLDRNLSQRRVFPAVDLLKSSTRMEQLLVSPNEITAANIMRNALSGSKPEEILERVINMFEHTLNNNELVAKVCRSRSI